MVDYTTVASLSGREVTRFCSPRQTDRESVFLSRQTDRLFEVLCSVGVSVMAGGGGGGRLFEAV